MVTFVTDCPRCSTTTEAPGAALLLGLGVSDRDDDGSGGTLWWICPACETLVGGSVGWTTLLRLVTAGVVLLEEEAEEPRPVHPEAPAGGPPLTLDDLLDLHDHLADPAWFAQLSAAGQPRVRTQTTP